MSHAKIVFIAGIAIVSLLALPAAAALSPQHQEWRNGPVQWLMTSEEQKAWKQLKTDDEATNFIDLFWARRDPTAGTAKNEFKEDFASHVKFADENYAEPRKRGALTDRGRALIVLGLPSNANLALHNLSQQSMGSTLSGAREDSRMKGTREVWLWEHDDAVAKFGMPKVEIVFIQDPVSGKVQRDPQRPDFMSAIPVAIKRSIVNPDLAAVPDWAIHGGLEATSPGGNAVASAATSAAASNQASSETPSSAARASRLTLIRDIYTIYPQSKNDPWAKLAPLATFASGSDLGWVAQYCTGTEDEPTLRYTLRITGTGPTRVADRVAPPDEIVPDRLKFAAGCYMLRGTVSLVDMEKGPYRFELAVENPATAARDQLAQEFTIE